MWILIALGASMFWGITYVLHEEIYRKISIFTSLGLSSFFIFITSISIAYYTDSLKPDLAAILESQKLFWYVIAGIITLLLAEFLIASSIVAKNATLAGLIEISYPIFIALFSYALFKNHVSLSTIFGAVIIFSGIFVIYYFNH